jgi:hypothetical protein
LLDEVLGGQSGLRSTFHCGTGVVNDLLPATPICGAATRVGASFYSAARALLHHVVDRIARSSISAGRSSAGIDLRSCTPRAARRAPMAASFPPPRIAPNAVPLPPVLEVWNSCSNPEWSAGILPIDHGGTQIKMCVLPAGTRNLNKLLAASALGWRLYRRYSLRRHSRSRYARRWRLSLECAVSVRTLISVPCAVLVALHESSYRRQKCKIQRTAFFPLNRIFLRPGCGGRLSC